MADVNVLTDPPATVPSSDPPGEPVEPVYDLIELLFFAYRSFVGDADEMLARYGFGRAHHRAMHFVARHPGITVADLLDILKITKQSLGRVLRDLVEDGFIVQREGQTDRRQRLLFLTDKGERLAADLADAQTHRLLRAVGGDSEGHAQARRLLAGILDPEERLEVERLIARGDHNTRGRRR